MYLFIDCVRVYAASTGIFITQVSCVCVCVCVNMGSFTSLQLQVECIVSACMTVQRRGSDIQCMYSVV